MKVGVPAGYGLAVSGIDISQSRLVPGAGTDGWLARLPGAIVWVPGGSPDAGELISACLAAISPTDLLGRVGSRLADPQAAPWPPFAIVAARGPELVAVVHGPVELVADQDGEEKRLYGGEDVGSWLNRLLKGTGALRAGNGGDDEGLADLREGVIKASGFVLVPAGQAGRLVEAPKQEAAIVPRPVVRETVFHEPVPESESPTFAEQPAIDTDITVVEHDNSDLDLLVASAGARVTLPTESLISQGANIQDANLHGASIRGVCCPRDHLNDPRDDFCRVCGLPLVPGGPETEGPRPPLGKLTWDNGEVDELIGAALVGRDVALDGAVVSGELSPLVPSGQNDSMSRVHAELRPSGWDAVVVDRGSTNGTFIWDEPSKAWQRLAPDEPHVVRPGSVLAFGERTATFETVAVAAGQ
jgi:FHA domain